MTESKPRKPVSSRRTLLKSAAAGLMLAPLPLRRAFAADAEVVYATWGGSWADAMRKAWFEPFTAQTGIKVRTIDGPDYGKIRAMVRANNTEWDVAEVNPDFQWIGPKEGLVEKLDFSIIPTDQLVKGPNLLTDYSLPEAFWSRVIAYNTNKFNRDNHPKDFAGFWDTARFPGKRVLYSKANGGAFEAALLADGVTVDKLYPLDIDRALKKLDKIKDDVLWYETNAQAVQYLQDQRGMLGLVADGRVKFIKDQGAPVEIEYAQSQLTWTSYVVIKGAPNKTNAMKLLAFMTSVDGQKAIGMAYTYGLVAPKAYDLLPPGRAELLSNGPQQQGKTVLMNEKWWGENLATAQEKMDAWRLS
ncbi:MAG TPA: ABC transporter substrate-binding protein [Stellaceae bacterium]|nr:ABC transporter substrate-binding protein [Stellaceae bacterium]